MDPSPVYIELEAMIEKNWVVQSLPTFGQQLEQLEKEGKISPQEHASLLKLYLGRPKQDD
jgi:hypothetical protein